MTRRPRGQEPPPSSPADHGRRLLVGLALVLVLFGLARLSARPPGPEPLDAPARRFSALRAAEVLDRLLDGDESPHPTGSEAAAALLERIRQEVARLEWDSEVQESIGVGPRGTVGRMRNLVSRRVGEKSDLPSVVLAAHYDSVGAGPGVADDLAGVAALLEVARALGRSQPQRTVVLLFTDGEEAGLVGAEAFLDGHPWAEDVGVVVNLEARGVSGASHMFQTGEDNAWLVSAWASEARRPDANSVSAEVYRRMPNDTDFSVFLERGITGLNFAFIGGWYAYHTPLDDREHLSLASLQHQGEQVLAAVRAVQHPGVRPAEGDAVYSTLFGRFVGRTSVLTTRLLALVGALGLLWALHRFVARGHLTWGRAFLGLAWGGVAVALPLALGLGYVTLLQALTGTPAPWHATASPSWIALVGLALWSTSVTGGLGGRLATPVGLALTLWAAWGVLGLFAAVFVPGASYLFAWPAFWIALCALGVRLQDSVPSRAARIALFTLVVALPLWAPVVFGLARAFGVGAAPLVLAALAFPLGLLQPLFALAPPVARRSVAGLGLACAVFGVVMTVILPHETGERPGQLNLLYAADAEQDRWEARSFGVPLPEELREAADWVAEEDHPSGLRVWSTPAPRLALPLPELEEVQVLRTAEDGVRVSGMLRSYALAARTRVEVGEGWRVREATVDGRGIGARGRFAVIAPGQAGVSVELVLAPTRAEPGPIEVELLDRVHGLPREGGYLVDARGATLVPSHDGDGSVLRATLSLALPDAH